MVNVLSDAEVYLVKLWTETREDPGAPPAWRGSATNVSTGDTKYFLSLAELVRHLSVQTGGFPIRV